MPEMMVVVCSACKVKMKVPETVAGKKLRCKSCEAVFVASAAPGKAAAPAPAKPAAAKAKAEPKKPAAAPPKPDLDLDDDNPEDNKKGYGITHTEEANRCPQCAAMMESEEAIICIHCGFNTRVRSLNRTRRIKDVDGQEKFLWRLPGMLSIAGILLLIGYFCFHHFAMPGMVLDGWEQAEDKHPTRAKALADDGVAGPTMLFHGGFELWMAVMFIFASYAMGRFAVNRLIINPNPPEVELN